MDDELQRPVSWERRLAWATAALVVAGAVSVGVVHSTRNADADRRIVAAAGETTGGVDPLRTSTTAALVVTTTAPMTTIPATPSTVKATTTSQVPRTSTTRAPSTTTTTAAPVPGPGKAVVTVANEFAGAVTLTLNGRVFDLAAGQQVGPFELALVADGNDSIGIRMVSVPTCGIGDAGGIFPGPGRYRLTITTGPNSCLADPAHPVPSPLFNVKAA